MSLLVGVKLYIFKKGWDQWRIFRGWGWGSVLHSSDPLASCVPRFSFWTSGGRK